jgi:YHS domain-containing protein
MMRSLLILFFVIVMYYAIRTVVRSAMRSFQKDERQRDRIQGEEMVQDPECRTYVPRSRAVTRQINGKLCAFCSEACAELYEKKART